MQQQEQGLENKKLQYTDKVLIGQGNQASVYKAKKNNCDIALRLQKRPFPSDIDQQNQLKEKNWKNCALPKDVFVYQNILYTEYELFLGDCCELIKGKKIHEWIEQFIIDVGNGLLQIHQDGYIHVDIKPANIVYKQENKNYSFSICDFSSLLREEDTKIKKCVGSPSYMPQEMSDQEKVLQNGYTNAVDVWAFGVTLFELITRKDLFKDSTMSEKGNQQFVDQQLQIVQHEFYKAVLTKLLRVDPEKRPTIKDFLEYFQSPQNRNHRNTIQNPIKVQNSDKTLTIETLEEFFKQHIYEYYMNEESDYPEFQHQELLWVESPYPD